LFNPNAEDLFNELEARDLIYDFNFFGSYPYIDMLRKQITGEIDSWAIRWYATMFTRNMLSLYPGKSLTCHIGDQSGTHCRHMIGKLHATTVSKLPIRVQPIPVFEKSAHRKIFAQYYSIGIKKSAMSELRRRHINSVMSTTYRHI
jgi:hypothetical protein